MCKFESDHENIYFVYSNKNYSQVKGNINFKDFQEDDRRELKKVNFIDIVSHNINLFSSLCLIDETFKNQMKNIFKLSTLTSLIENYSVDQKIRSSLISMFDYLYLRDVENFRISFGLCRKISRSSLNSIKRNKVIFS